MGICAEMPESLVKLSRSESWTCDASRVSCDLKHRLAVAANRCFLLDETILD